MTTSYRLTCTECAFEDEVDGLERALDRADVHSNHHVRGHFVNMELRDGCTTTDQDYPTTTTGDPTSLSDVSEDPLDEGAADDD